MRFPYRDIAGVRLSYAPSCVDSARYRCDLTMRSGGKIAILSTHYAGLADFEELQPEGGAFMGGMRRYLR